MTIFPVIEGAHKRSRGFLNEDTNIDPGTANRSSSPSKTKSISSFVQTI